MSDSDEEDGEHKALRDQYANLCDRMESSGLRTKLYTERHLTPHENDAIRKARDRSRLDENEALLFAVSSRSNAVLIRFCELLFEDNQVACGTALMKAFENHGVDVSNLKKSKKSQEPPLPSHRAPQYIHSLEELDVPFTTFSIAVNKFVVGRDNLKKWSFSLLKSMKSRTSQGQAREIDEVVNKVFHCESNDRIFQLLQTLVPPLDIRLFEKLIELACGETEEIEQSEIKVKLKTYKDMLRVECKTTLDDCKKALLEEPTGDSPDDTVRVGVQTGLTPQHTDIQFILDMKQYFVKKIGMTETEFEGFSCSNVTLFFSVSKDRLPFLVHWCFLHRRDLMDKFSVELVFSPGHFVYSLYADQEYPYPQAILPQPQPVVPEKKTVDVLSEMEKNLTDTLQKAIWNGHKAFESKNEQYKSELHVKMGEVQEAILSVGKELKPSEFPEVFERLQSLKALIDSRDDEKKGTLAHSVKQLDSRMDIFKDEYSVQVSTQSDKFKAMLETFSLQFKQLGDALISEFQAAVKKQMHAMDEPFQIEIPMDMSGLIIGTRGTNLRKIENKTGVQKIAVKPSTVKKGKADVSLFGDPEACDKAKVEIRIMVAQHVNMSRKSTFILTYFPDDQQVSFRGLRAHEDVLQTKHYNLVAVENMTIIKTDQLRNLDILAGFISSTLSDLLKSPTPPQLRVEARLGHLFWKTEHMLSQSDLERQYTFDQLEKEGILNVEKILGKNFWTFSTDCKSRDSGKKPPQLYNPERLGLTFIGEMNVMRLTFVYMPKDPDRDYALYGLNARVLPEGKCQFVSVTPRMKKETMYDCLPLEGNLDIRIAINSGPAMSDKDKLILEKVGRDITSRMTLKEGSLELEQSSADRRVLHVRHSKKKLHLMSHEGGQYILVDCDVQDCHVGRYDLPDSTTTFPLKDCHKEVELWNSQWIADFALLEGKDWREYFASNGCDVSMIQLSPRPVQVDNIVRELGAYVRCALKIAEA